MDNKLIVNHELLRLIIPLERNRNQVVRRNTRNGSTCRIVRSALVQRPACRDVVHNDQPPTFVQIHARLMNHKSVLVGGRFILPCKRQVVVALCTLRRQIVRVVHYVPATEEHNTIFADDIITLVDLQCPLHFQVGGHIGVADLGFPVNRCLLTAKEKPRSLAVVPVMNHLECIIYTGFIFKQFVLPVRIQGFRVEESVAIVCLLIVGHTGFDFLFCADTYM